MKKAISSLAALFLVVTLALPASAANRCIPLILFWISITVRSEKSMTSPPARIPPHCPWPPLSAMDSNTAAPIFSVR